MNPLQERTMKSAIYTFINGYLNAATGEYLQYNAVQMNYVYDLLEGIANTKNPEDILSHIQDIEENMATSSLTPEEQMPLLFATQIGKTAYSFWANLMVTGMGPWTNFTNSFTPNIVKFPFWVSAAMEGTLIASSYLHQQTKGGVLATEMQVLINYASGASIIINLAGALVVGAGKVVFQLKQRKLENKCMPAMTQEMPTMNSGLDFLNKPCNC